LITARMVLTHRTGFPNWRSGKLDLKFTPGTKASYSGEGFVYLGKVVEHLTGKKLVELCQEDVFKPLEMDNAYLMWDERVARLTSTGHNGVLPLSKWKPDRPNMASSLHVDAGTYAKFLIGIIEGTGLSEATFKEMLRAQSTIPEQNDTSFGLGIAMKETPQGIFYGHGGRNTGFTSVSAVYKDQKVGYVFLVNNEENERFDDVLNAYLIGGKAGLKSKSK
jgi:CubicO group peptidase (beta-lactamase class C family)